MQNPSISVIIPLYNKEAIVGRTIDSVLSQSITSFELIIVDDGSTDGSMQIVHGFNDNRVNIIEQTNRGPGAARNTGVRAAHSDWIVFLDADDELMSDALENFWKKKKEHEDADIINCSSCINSADGIKGKRHKEDGYVSNNFKFWFYGGLMPGTGHSLFSKKMLEQFPYDERFRRYEDAELLFRLLRQSKIYNSQVVTLKVNTAYSAASRTCRNIEDDFIGHLYLKGLSFWERMCMYKLYLVERDNYANDIHKCCSTWRYRFDLLLLYKIINKCRV